MPDSVTPLDGASCSGFVTIRDAGPRGMIQLRAELDDAGVASALKGAGFDLPGVGELVGTLERGVLWMSPDEQMILCRRDEAEATVATLAEALGGLHALVANVSDARAVFRLTGEGAAVREMLAKLSPADLRRRALPPGRVRRTRLAQVPAAFWFVGDDEAVLTCFRSVAGYVLDLLSKATTPGSEVGHF